MQTLEDQQLLQHLAYQSWLDRGQPHGSPEIDWSRAQEQLRQQHAATLQMSAEQLADRPTNFRSDISSAEAVAAQSVPTINDAVAAPKSRRSNIRIKAAEVPLEVPPSPTTPPDQPPTKAKSKRSPAKVAATKPRLSYDSQSDDSRL